MIRASFLDSIVERNSRSRWVDLVGVDPVVGPIGGGSTVHSATPADSRPSHGRQTGFRHLKPDIQLVDQLVTLVETSQYENHTADANGQGPGARLEARARAVGRAAPADRHARLLPTVDVPTASPGWFLNPSKYLISIMTD